MSEKMPRWFNTTLAWHIGARWLVVLVAIAGLSACRRDGAVEQLVAEGVSLASADRTRDALAHFDQALALAPDHPAALVNGGLAALLEGHASIAKERLERYLSGNENDVLPRVYLAHALLALEDREGAIAALQHAVRFGFRDLDALTDGSFGPLHNDIRFIQLASLIAQRRGHPPPVDDRGRPLFGGMPVRSLSGPSLPSPCAAPTSPPIE